MAEPTKEELAQWLDEAADLIGDWGAYAGDYFQKKWDLDGDIQKFRERAAAARGVEGRTEYGWLIENGKQQGAGLAYRYIDNDSGGIPGWTEDPNKALRFARREDAEQFAHHDEDAWRIVEHVWDSPGVGVAPATFDKPLNTEPPSKCEFPACAVHHICSRNCERNAGVKERERG